MSVKSRVQELNTRLAEKLTIKGVEADGTETTTALINKVDQIITGETNVDYYIGDYEVTPKVEEQKLETKNLLMEKDVTVHKIPFSKTSNNAGGNTVVIA